jgi:hypothetical protein
MPKWRFWKKIYYTKLQRELRNFFFLNRLKRRFPRDAAPGPVWKTSFGVHQWQTLYLMSKQSPRPSSATASRRIGRWTASIAS